MEHLKRLETIYLIQAAGDLIRFWSVTFMAPVGEVDKVLDTVADNVTPRSSTLVDISVLASGDFANCLRHRQRKKR
jgi:hypothetical protein